MKRQTIVGAMISAVIAVAWGAPLSVAQQAMEQERDQIQAQERVKNQEQIYGSQLMTEQERAAHRAQMRNAKSEGEREQIRAEHHNKMQARAKEQGVTLPDEPPQRGARGQGQGAQDGSGMGQGQGRGQGRSSQSGKDKKKGDGGR